VAGRHRELRELKRIIDRAADGFGQTVVVVGDAGIGKSTLLDAAASFAPNGSVVISIRAVEAESHLAYAAAIDFLGPLLHRSAVADGLPDDALRLLDHLVAARPLKGGIMSLCRAALGAVLAACAAGPLILFVVDDAQWLDEPSSEILLYVARRVLNEQVAVILGIREGTTSRLAAADLPMLVVDGLSVFEVGQLLAPFGVVEPVAAALHGLTGGNPLALLEITRSLTADERSGRSGLAPFPEVGTATTQAFGRRIGALPEATREALVVVAAHGSGDTSVLYGALAALGHEPAVLVAAEDRQIINIHAGSVTFVHPLLRLVAYSSVAAVLRQSAHAALAGAWWPEQTWRGAWHLAESAPAPDEAIAASIEAVAEGARTRCPAIVIAELFRRAADLSTDPIGRERRWMAAARGFTDAARPTQAAAELQKILATTADSSLRADATLMYGLYVAFSESPRRACELLRAEAARIDTYDATRAVLLLSVAYTAAMLGLEMTTGAEVVAHAGRLATAAGPIGTLAVHALQVQEALLAGRSDEALRGIEPIQQLATALVAGGVVEGDELLQQVAAVYLACDRWEESQATMVDVIRRGRSGGRDYGFDFAFAVASESALRLGRWSEAYVSARGTADLYAGPVDADWATLSSMALCARVEAHLGLTELCRAHAETVIEGAGRIGSVLLVTWARHALGFLALSLGEHTEAIRHLEVVADVAHRSGVREPGFISWPGDLFEAYWRSNRLTEATRVRTQLRAAADATARVSAQMVVARADALLGPSERAEESFARSVDLGHQLGATFEIARTQLLLAEWRITNGGEAEDPLHSAHAAFQRLGAEQWAKRCVLLGSVVGAPTSASPAGRLAERELEAALLAARGLTNREIADELYLSPKTVENTLGKVYRKLAVRSRTQLAILLLSNSS
jgi:DNA-binding CsgD family transcriptional regulator